MGVLGTMQAMADREEDKAINHLEKKRNDLVMVLGWVEHQAAELRDKIEGLTQEISAEIRHRGR